MVIGHDKYKLNNVVDKELYNKRQELDRMLNEILDKLNKLGYPIYVYE